MQRRWGLAAVALAAMAAMSGSSQAQGRPSTTRMTCAAAKALVNRNGAIVLGTGGDTYDRFVSAEGYCPTGYYARPAFEPTRDAPQCDIGFYCTTVSPFLR